jgi:phospholipase/carboxylesterase
MDHGYVCHLPGVDRSLVPGRCSQKTRSLIPMLETDLSITAEIRLYYDLYVPDEIVRPAPLLIAVHGYGAHKRYMMREARLIADERFVIASIQAPHPHFRPTNDGYRIGYGWLAGEEHDKEHIALHHRFVLDLIDGLVDEGTIDRERVFMFGFSQACALDFRFALTYPDVLTGIIGVCGGIPGDLDSNGDYKPFNGNTLYLYGDDDEFYTQEQFAEFDAKLTAMLPKYYSKH